MFALTLGAPLQPLALEPSRSGLVCLSTAVDMKSAACNLGCNDKRATSPRRQKLSCPDECLCLRTSNKEALASNLSLTMPAEEFRRLSETLGATATAVAFTSSSRAPASASHSQAAASRSSSATLPKEMSGFYMKTWNLDSCKEPGARLCAGPENKNINVAFSGEAILIRALNVTLKQQQKAFKVAGECPAPDKRFCNMQVRNKMPWEAKTRELAIQQVVAPGAWTEEQCKGCFNDELNITTKAPELPSEAKMLRPFSREAGLHAGLQFLSLGGASAEGTFNVASLAGFFTGDLQTVKEAGFDGICFDIELTKGAEELVEKFEEAYAACKKAGMLVMITTSHSAPYAASTNHAKQLFVDSWTKSRDIDIFSPQLYTSGYEANPQFDMTPCSNQDGIFSSKCSWERLKPMKASWVPSLKDVSHYAASKDYFEKIGIKTHGFVQWADAAADDTPEVFYAR
jgi:hypothetical protein